MAFSDIRTYFKDRLSEVDSDFKEWTDAFNIENVPATFYDKFYHISYGGFDGGTLGGKTQGAIASISLRCGFKGYRNVSENLDIAMDLMESVIASIQAPQNRLGEVLKNVKFNTMNVSQSFNSNDNLFLVTQDYEVTLILCAGG